MTEDRENLGLLYILCEEPGNGFKKALGQFRESVGLHGITVAKAVLTVNDAQMIVPTPNEITDELGKIMAYKG